MIIQDKIKPKEVEFYTVSKGNVFMCSDVYYLAIDDLEDSRGNEKNAIDLEDGEAIHFDGGAMVVLVKATLVIESR